MSFLPIKKNKINLSDFNYRREIEIRLLMARLTSFELEVLNEILNNSLIIPLNQLVEILETPKSKLLKTIQKFIDAKLIKQEKETLYVDKELRKQFESHMIKFDPEFEPGMEYIQALLNKVPIHHLPQWYALPRTSDNIFQSIIERFLATPKMYEKYLQELQFDEELLPQISKAVFDSPDFYVTGRMVMENHDLSHSQFEEIALLLEYNLVCCLTYREINGQWEETLTPFHEWRQYLCFMRDAKPKPIPTKTIVPKDEREFGFIQDMSLLLKAASKKPVSPSSILTSLQADDLEKIIQKIEFHHLGEMKNNKLSSTQRTLAWLDKSLQEKALTFSRHPTKVEKELKQVMHTGWIYVDDFIRFFTGNINGKEPIQLQQKGKRWKYALPSYTKDEEILIATTLCERLFEAGFVDVGTHAGKICVRVTPFGRMSLED